VGDNFSSPVGFRDEDREIAIAKSIDPFGNRLECRRSDFLEPFDGAGRQSLGFGGCATSRVLGWCFIVEVFQPFAIPSNIQRGGFKICVDQFLPP